MNYYRDILKSWKSLYGAGLGSGGVATKPQKGWVTLVRSGQNAGRSVFIHDSTSLTESSARLLDRCEEAGQSADRWELWGAGGCAGQKESVWGFGGRRGSCMAESSWAPRVASFCWAAHPVLILSWSRNRRQRPTRRCPCGLCTGCCQTSS